MQVDTAAPRAIEHRLTQNLTIRRNEQSVSLQRLENRNELWGSALFRSFNRKPKLQGRQFDRRRLQVVATPLRTIRLRNHEHNVLRHAPQRGNGEFGGPEID